MNAPLAPVGRAGFTPPADSSSPVRGLHASTPLMPVPSMATMDALATLYTVLSKSSQQQQEMAKSQIEANAKERQEKMAEHQRAVEAARKAAEEKHGFFDSMGVGSLVAIAVGSPWLAVADMTMHMGKLTPDFLEDFEAKNLQKLADAANAYAAVGALETVMRAGVCGPGALAAMVQLGGLLVKETKMLGEEKSDWVGRGGMLGGAIGMGDARAASIGFVGDKNGAVTNEIRHVEDETQAYTKYATYVAMGLAAAGSIVATAGTGTAFAVVLVGVALSLSGAVVTETEAFGDTSKWIGMGLMGAGALMSGAGVATAAMAGASGAGTAAAKALEAGQAVVEGVGKTNDGARRVEQSLRDHEVALREADAKRADLATKRLARTMDCCVQVAQDAREGFQRIAARIRETLEQDAQTSMVSMNAMRG